MRRLRHSKAESLAQSRGVNRQNGDSNAPVSDHTSSALPAYVVTLISVLIVFSGSGAQSMLGDKAGMGSKWRDHD